MGGNFASFFLFWVVRRELISFPHIDSYPALLLVGFLTGYWLACRNAPQFGVARRHIDNLTLSFAVVGIAGARVFSWLFYQPKGISLAENLKIWGPGGLVFYGGMIFVIGFTFLYCRWTHLRLRSIFDLYAPSLALGLAFGRVGCFLAGCCWGDVCISPAGLSGLSELQRRQIQTAPALSRPGFPLAVVFPANAGAFEQHLKLGLIKPGAARSLPVHPAQLYEAIGAFLLSIGLQRHLHRHGAMAAGGAWFCLGYGMLRFLVEFLRADSAPVYFGLTISQVISAAFMGVGLAFLRTSGISTVSPAPGSPRGIGA